MIESHPRIVFMALVLLSVGIMLAFAALFDALEKHDRRFAHRGPKRLRTNVRRPASDLPSILERQTR